MTDKTKTVLKVVESAKKPKGSKRTGSGNGSGSGSGKSDQNRFGEYAIIGGAFHQIKSVRSGGDDRSFVEIPLCNFTGKILEEISQDNGLEDTAILRIEGSRQDGLPLPVADVPASKFMAVKVTGLMMHGEHGLLFTRVVRKKIIYAPVSINFLN